MCVYVYVYACVCLCVHAMFISMFIRSLLTVCVCTCMCVCVCMRVFMLCLFLCLSEVCELYVRAGGQYGGGHVGLLGGVWEVRQQLSLSARVHALIWYCHTAHIHRQYARALRNSQVNKFSF
jgi:hypothetical protein